VILQTPETAFDTELCSVEEEEKDGKLYLLLSLVSVPEEAAHTKGVKVDEQFDIHAFRVPGKLSCLHARHVRISWPIKQCPHSEWHSILASIMAPQG